MPETRHKVAAARSRLRSLRGAEREGNGQPHALHGHAPNRKSKTANALQSLGSLDDLIEGCMLIGFDWTYLYVNAAAAKYSHKGLRQFLGRKMLEVHPGLKGSPIHAACRRVMKRRTPQYLESAFAFPDGATGWYQLSIEPAPEGIFVLSMDITQRKQAESALERSNRALRTLSVCDDELAAAGDENEWMGAVCKLLVERSRYQLAWVGLVDRSGRVNPAVGYHARSGRAETAVAISAFTDHRALARRACRFGKRQQQGATATKTQAMVLAAGARRRYARSVVALPLKIAAATLGVLVIRAAEPGAFDPEEIRLLEEMATKLALGIDGLRTRAERDRMAESQRHQEERLRGALEESIKIIAGTVEMRDPYTAGHQHRVGELSVAIAREMGLPADRIEALRLAAVIHDVGKIVLPGEILAKPGKLSPIEQQLIRTHAQAGRDLLKDVPFPWPIADIIWQHHELLDGSGYPRGLKGSQILLESRILAVADVIEAVASHRPYRPALGLAKALQSVRKGKREGLYDPHVVNACLRMFQARRFAFAGMA